MKFSKNEKELLKVLLGNGRATDTEISKKIGISVQAVGKIRKKLEKDKVITSYRCTISFEKLGINFLVLFRVKPLPAWWKKHSLEETENLIRKAPQVISSARIYGGDQYINLLGFRSKEEFDDYLILLKREQNDVIEFEVLKTFSDKALVKFSSADLCKEVLDEKSLLYLNIK